MGIDPTGLAALESERSVRQMGGVVGKIGVGARVGIDPTMGMAQVRRGTGGDGAQMGSDPTV